MILCIYKYNPSRAQLMGPRIMNWRAGDGDGETRRGDEPESKVSGVVRPSQAGVTQLQAWAGLWLTGPGLYGSLVFRDQDGIFSFLGAFLWMISH